MIQNSFIFLPRIKQKKEQNIWDQGVNNWNDFLTCDIKGISKPTKANYNRIIEKSKQALRENNSNYFVGKLSSIETWRLYDYFKDEAIFLDIEASSSTSKNAYLTVIGIYDGMNTKIMVKNYNLDLNKLKNELHKYKLIITFNGSSFDIPFLNKKHPGVLPRIPHIDLRHICAKIGLTGGLKQIEKKLKIKRSNIIIEKLYGGDPIKLYRMFLGSGDPYYLKLLVEYNEEDVINLKKIADYSINKLKNEILTNRKTTLA
ncbi:hypothetical protein HN789_05275 [archaeon]|jgi:uncharacterized protein|nr:hypothetical protein [archaeon]MBT4022923.1 hypothetical protein [archaeon]MBT4271914.1 hypothetical protein [archaeon]MBT4461752.1 hypothetical protein [archaeon]MBT4858720.1 hypothetical protein [archaeon]